MLEECIHGLTAVVEILWQLSFGIALGHKGDMDAMQRVGSLLQCDVGRLVYQSADEDVLRVDLVLHRGHNTVVEVADFNVDRHAVAWIGDEEHVLKRALYPFGFSSSQPFLKERRETVTVERVAMSGIADRDAAVAFER